MADAAVQRFAFPREFAGSARDAQAPDLATLQAELTRLAAERDAAYQAGLAAGAEQARAERGEALLAAVDALGAGLEALDEELAALRDATARDGAELALVAAGHLAAAIPPAVPVDRAIGRALDLLARGTELEVRVAPDLASEVERLLAERQAGERRRLHVKVVPDAGLQGGDARLCWDGGGLELDRAARDAALREELSHFLPELASGRGTMRSMVEGKPA